MAMKHLALRGDRGSSSAREIAEHVRHPDRADGEGAPAARAARAAGVASGTRGGYQLARAAGQISVADVIQAIDGPVTVTACSTDEGQCEQFAKCNVRDPLWRVRERILTALGECTIAELAAEVPMPASRRRCCTRTFERGRAVACREKTWL